MDSLRVLVAGFFMALVVALGAVAMVVAISVPLALIGAIIYAVLFILGIVG